MAADAAVRVLAMGDFGHERCGVGGSEATLAERVGGVTVLDTEAPGVGRFARRARVLARSGAVCVGVYPTRSTVYRVGLLPRALVLRLVFGRRRFRLHLHEFQHLRRLLKWPVKLALLLPGRVVVSSASEQAAVRSALAGLVGRVTDVVVAPPTNGSTPAPDEVVAATTARPDAARTVGVFGALRPDKGADWLEDVLLRLAPTFDHLVLAGAGWDEHEWPPAVSGRYRIEVLGHVARSTLADLFASFGLAVAPMWEPAHDGRMSLRTPLAFGVPTLTVGPRTDDLTLAPDHLLLLPPADPSAFDPGSFDRPAGAAQVSAFEAATTERLAAALFS